MINVIASIQIKEGKMAEFLEIFKANVPNVFKEDGCIDYMPTIDVPSGLSTQAMDANVVTIIEKWDNVEALKAHLETPHMVAYSKKVKNLVEKVSLKVLKEA